MQKNPQNPRHKLNTILEFKDVDGQLYHSYTGALHLRQDITMNNYDVRVSVFKEVNVNGRPMVVWFRKASAQERRSGHERIVPDFVVNPQQHYDILNAKEML